jgi:hypothetical protein
MSTGDPSTRLRIRVTGKLCNNHRSSALYRKHSGVTWEQEIQSISAQSLKGPSYTETPIHWQEG